MGPLDGQLIKEQPAGADLFIKRAFDGLGRETKRFTGFDTDETAYADAGTVTGDTILEQVEFSVDESGNVIQTVTRQRYHDATGTGELTSPGGAQPKARVTTVAAWQDALGREIGRADYGTNGGSALSRPDTVPARSDTVLVTRSEHNDRGEKYKTIDPAGREDRREYDDAEQLTKLIENYVDGDPDTGGSDADRTTAWTYTADGKVASITASNADTGDQVTQYVYGTTLSDSEVARSDLLRAEIYPDSDDVASPLGDGSDGVYDRIEYKYNRQEERTGIKDQNGTVRALDYDKLGRQTQDRVVTLGSGVDGAVRRLAITYEVRDQPQKVTSYDDATVGQGNVVNEIQFAYNDFRQLVTDYQSHSGAVNTQTTPKVQYGFANGSANTIRPTGLTYPDGRVLSYDYGSSGSAHDAAGRVASLIDDDAGATHLADYEYLGRQAFVEVDYTEPDVRYTLVGTAGGNDPDTGDVYRGLDRFGRVKDALWHDYGATADADRIKHGYDRAGNRTYRENTVDSGDAHDELYGYDGLHRLTDFDRGALNGTKDGISTLTFAQQWSLDATGNWGGFQQDDDGDATWDLDQSRTANKVNEITDVSETAGASWITPAHDRAGNMTTIPQPADPTQSFTATYDAWNRLVKLTDGTNTLAEYAYDGLRRRTIQKSYTGGTLDESRHFYYTPAWQLLEERVDTSSDPDRQFVWGLRYVDDLVCRDRDTTGDGALDERLYALQDANWNVTALVDASGGVQERFAYHAYGTPVVLTPAFGGRGSSSYDWETLFAGYRYDGHTALYHVRNRVLHSPLGSWLQRDPQRYADSWILYEYVGTDPVDRTDPTGLLWYGNYCGPGNSGGVPIDVLDTCCLIHDRCYTLCGANWWNGLPFCSTPCTRACDRALCLCARAAPCATVACRAYRAAVIAYFC